jgi:RHS repeat-associated protein
LKKNGCGDGSSGQRGYNTKKEAFVSIANIKSKSNGNELYLNSTPIATITPKGIYRIYADHLDTSRRVATNNEKAEVLWSWESKPFGESKANSDVDGDGEIFTLNLRFPGQYFDGEISTHYNINRDYNPVTGRYIQSDIIGICGGNNTYLYANANSYIYKDPSGELALSTVVGGFTAFLIAWGYYSTTITIDLIADGCRDILDTAGCYNLNLNDQHYTAKYLSCQNTEKDCHALMIKEGAGIYGLPGLF